MGDLCDILPDMCGQDLVDDGLVAHAAPARFLTELIEHARIHTNRDELARFISKGRPTHPSHRLQLLGRRLGNVREVNLSPRTPHARDGSPAAR